MAHPTALLPAVPPLPPAVMISGADGINAWLTALKTCWKASTEPVSPGNGQLWYDTSPAAGPVLRLRMEGVWRVLQSDVGQTVNDLDTAITDGPFRFGSVAANVPFPGTAGSGITIARPDSATQFAFAQQSSRANMVWVRSSLNTAGTSWTLWTRVFTQADIVGTVTRSGGVPDGAVIESDVLSSGHYVRFADGTQICHATRTLTRDDTSRLHNLWTFPRAFVDGDYRVHFALRSISAAAGRSQLSTAMVGDVSTTTQLRSLLYHVAGLNDFLAGDTATLDETVIGRWANP